MESVVKGRRLRVECGEGWKSLYEPLLKLCELMNVEVTQVKEKFGTLRFYIAGVPEEQKWLYNIIDAMTTESAKVCEECGRRDGRYKDKSYTTYVKVTTEGSWLLTLCEECRAERDARRKAEDEEFRAKRQTKRENETASS